MTVIKILVVTTLNLRHRERMEKGDLDGCRSHSHSRLTVPLATVWVFVLWGRPAIARARVEHETVMIRDRIMDGILSGDIDKDDPRAVDALTYCKVSDESFT